MWSGAENSASASRSTRLRRPVLFSRSSWICSAEAKTLVIHLGEVVRAIRLKAKGNAMRMFVAFLIFLSAAYYWDAEYNHGKLSDGVRNMGRSISHSMGH
jgi:hypothetical protein